MKRNLVPFAAFLALSFASFTSCQQEVYAGYSGELMDSSWAWVTSYSEGECPNKDNHYKGGESTGGKTSADPIVVTSETIQVEAATADYQGIYIDFFMDENVPAANIGTFTGKKTTSAYSYEVTYYSDGSKSNNKAEKLADASVSYSDLVYTHVDKAIISESGMETPPFRMVFSNDEGKKLAAQTCLSDASGNGYALTYDEDDDELNLLYDTKDIVCTSFIDNNKTKCNTTYQKKYYGRWTAIDHADTM